jgi:hypothetical protein
MASHVTVYRWVLRFTPLLAEGCSVLPTRRRRPLQVDVVAFSAAFEQEFFDVRTIPLAPSPATSTEVSAVGQAVAQVPADRDGDDLGREAEADEGRPRNRSRARAAGSHASRLTPRMTQPTQQSHPGLRRCPRAGQNPQISV